ncbi:unnamed protein product, partial [marine sediment metagenome]
MPAVVYKWGKVSTDSYSLIKAVTLPSAVTAANPVTFHAENGSNYRVPAGKRFIVTQWMLKATIRSYIGESDSADGDLTKILKPVYYT